MAGLTAVELSSAEQRHVRRLVDKTIAKCANEIDAACRSYDQQSQQRALALTVLDGLTLAVITGFFPDLKDAEQALGLHGQHCLMRLAQLAKKGPGLVQ